MKKLYKIEDGRKLCGVCGGFALYLNLDVTLVRVLWVIITLSPFPGLIAYIICALIMPEERDVIKVIKRKRKDEK